MTRTGCCLQLGIEKYDQMLQLQTSLNQARRAGAIPDTVIFLEHAPCFTVGRRGGFEHILVSDSVLQNQGIMVYETDRGGDITYHGPGQLICYPIINLDDYGRDVHLYARRMEETLVRTLEFFGIVAGRKQGYPGVWVGQSKIAAEGISVRHWITMHGVSLNVCPNMFHFSLIVPCGITEYGVTSMEEVLGGKVDIAEVRKEMCYQFSQVFEIQLEDIDLEELRERAGDIG